MDFTECKCRLLATIEMINKRHGKEITDMPYPGRVWEVLIRPALLSDTKYFSLLHSKRKGINVGNGI